MAVAHDDDLVANIKVLCKRCVMKMTAMPRADMLRMESSSAAASFSVRTAGRLVENKQLEMLLAQLARDLRELLMADRHIADDHVGVDVDAIFSMAAAALRSISL